MGIIWAIKQGSVWFYIASLSYIDQWTAICDLFVYSNIRGVQPTCTGISPSYECHQFHWQIEITIRDYSMGKSYLNFVCCDCDIFNSQDPLTVASDKSVVNVLSGVWLNVTHTFFQSIVSTAWCGLEMRFDNGAVVRQMFSVQERMEDIPHTLSVVFDEVIPHF